jgi:hypothetical protein
VILFFILLAAAELMALPSDRWCVTRGKPSAQVNEAKFRAVAPSSDGDTAEVRFTYLGPSDLEKPLASGQPRRQVGLKLRAEDGCNLLYVMWRVAPKNEIVVSLKRNPGKKTHHQCGNDGYRNYKPRHFVAPAAPAHGSRHSLSAAIENRTLRVFTDGNLAWEGELDDAAAALRGPAGVRSDNLKLDLELRIRPGKATTSARCLSAEDED